MKLSCFICSYDTGTISGILAMPYWQRLFSTGYVDPDGNLTVTASQESAIVSILSAGTFFGALTSPLLTDYLGRRPGLLISTWVFNLGVVLHTVATAIPMFLAGRFFAGFGVGLISAMSGLLNYIHLLQHSYLTLPTSSSLPIRNSPQMGSRCHCRCLSVGYHYWTSSRRYCE